MKAKSFAVLIGGLFFGGIIASYVLFTLAPILADTQEHYSKLLEFDRTYVEGSIASTQIEWGTTIKAEGPIIEDFIPSNIGKNRSLLTVPREFYFTHDSSVEVPEEALSIQAAIPSEMVGRDIYAQAPIVPGGDLDIHFEGSDPVKVILWMIGE